MGLKFIHVILSTSTAIGTWQLEVDIGSSRILFNRDILIKVSVLFSAFS